MSKRGQEECEARKGGEWRCDLTPGLHPPPCLCGWVLRCQGRLEGQGDPGAACWFSGRTCRGKALETSRERVREPHGGRRHQAGRSGLSRLALGLRVGRLGVGRLAGAVGRTSPPGRHLHCPLSSTSAALKDLVSCSSLERCQLSYL